MRKTSQDGGDSTSITSGIENEIKKSGAIIKTKTNSIKRKVQNFSLEPDDAVIEPLLQKDKNKADVSKQSGKNNLVSKVNKTEANTEQPTQNSLTGSDKNKLIPDYKLQDAALSNAANTSESTLPACFMKDISESTFTSSNAPLHNHMNTNVFSTHDSSKGFIAPKSQILVEIDGSKQIGYSPSPLIFTTAKIHSDGKTKHMEPLQVTPVPILSTIEVSVVKSGISKGEFSGHVSSNISAICTNITKQDQKSPNNTPTPPGIANQKISNASDKSFGLSSLNKETISNKCPLYNVKTDVQENNCTMQPINSASHKIPTIQSEIKAVTVPPPVTKTTTSNNYIKDTGVLDQTVLTKQETTYTPRYQERKIELNKKEQDSMDLQRSNAPDTIKLQGDAENACNKTSNDNPMSNSSAKLRRQNIEIEKDNPISKLRPNNVSTSLCNDANSFKKSDEYRKSSVIVGNILSDKTKLPKSSAKSVPVSTATTSSIKNNLVDNKFTKTFPITTTITANKTSTSLASTAKIQNAFNTVITTTSTTISSASITTIGSGNIFSSSATATTFANKITAPSTTIEAANKYLTSLSTVATTNKTTAPINKIAATNKISAPTSTMTVVDKPPTSNFISSVNSNTYSATTQSTSLNTTKPATITTTTGAGSIKSGTTNTEPQEMSQAVSTISNKPLSSTVSSRSKKVSKVPTAIVSFQPTTLVKSPMVTTSKSHNIKTITPTTVAISTENSFKSFTTNPKTSSAINNSINSGTATSASLTVASSGSSSKPAASNHNDTKPNEKNNAKNGSKA